MKKVFLCLFLVVFFGLMGCAGNKSDNVSIVGKWKLDRSDQTDLVLELTSLNKWKFYIDGKMVEEGTFVIEGTEFIMKHNAEEHKHEDGSVHAHGAVHDHVYEFQLSSNKKQMKLIQGDQTSVYYKL